MSAVVFQAVRKLIEKHVGDNHAGGNLTNIHFEGVDFTAQAGHTWINVAIRFGASEQVNVGGSSGRRMERHAGVVIVNVFSKPKAGTDASLGVCDAVGAMLRMRQLSNSDVTITLRTPEVTRVPDEKQYMRHKVSVAFHADAFF